MAADGKATAPARLYVLLARNAPVGVILRRGPSKWVQVIRWNTIEDTFELGHWFKGRIYNEYCDLSPSGAKLIYLAAKHDRHLTADPTYTYSWTAVSHVPYLTAVALWPLGDTWYGGGLFASERSIWLHHTSRDVSGQLSNVMSILTPHPNHRPPKNVQIRPYPYWTNPEAVRLVRDGWTRREDGETRTDITLLVKPYTEEKRGDRYLYRANAARTHILRRRSLDWSLSAPKVTYRLRRNDEAPDAGEYLEGAEWADWDSQGRLVCARAGKLYTVSTPSTGNDLEWQEIADFNDSKPYNLPPPEWARVW
jgi:hypothetical protein